jgi:hypothetical protein
VGAAGFGVHLAFAIRQVPPQAAITQVTNTGKADRAA